MQYRKNSSFLVVSTSVYSVQTLDKSDTTDKLSLRLTLVELAAGLLQFMFSQRVLLQAALTTAFRFSCLLSQLGAVAGAQQVALIQTYAGSKSVFSSR